MKTIKKSIEITAPKEQVWAVILEDSYSRDWMSHFCVGTHAVTDWIVGHKVVFENGTGSGISGKIKEKRPYEFLSIVYDGMIVNGKDDFDSEESKAMKGAVETYELSDHNGNTFLSISSDIGDEYFDEMSNSWDAALQRISELSHAI